MANLGLVIKNAFLMVLIIWILHFLLKNVLTTAKPAIPADVASEGEEVEDVEEAQIPPTERIYAAAPASATESTGTAPAKDDLYDFIFRADSSTQQVPKPDITSTKTKPPTDATEPTLALTKRSNRHWVKEYDGEKLLNGGELCQGLNPYDQDFSPYDTLAVEA